MLAEARDIAGSLGLKPLRGSPLALVESIKSGLPLASLERLAAKVAPGDSRFVHRFVPRATLTRRKSQAEPRLTVDEGNRVAALAKVWDVAMEIFRDEDKARAFLHRPHMLLDGQKPIDVAVETGVGADLVVNLLGSAAYGGTA
jgi:putative toxin-antitoxin system antitoxin component (TIGR02293 family)